MSRANNVRGPTSALTEFLRESGITATSIARRVATRNQQEEQPATAGPSNQQDSADTGNQSARRAETTTRDRRARARTRTRSNLRYSGNASDELDESEHEAPTEAQQNESTAAEADTEKQPAGKKRKLTKAAQAKLKAKEKKKRGIKDSDDDDYMDEDDDAYTAPSRLTRGAGGAESRPAPGSFENCVKCKKKFTVTVYTVAAVPGPGWLCHPCAKASGTDPFKKPQPTRRKAQVDKRTVTSFEERRFPSLVSLCVQLITKYIDDVESLGDIGTMNVDNISRALSKNRSLTSENVQLFYSTNNTTLTLYDATNLPPDAFSTLAYLNPNLTSLRLDFCGQINDDAFNTISTSLPALTHIELLGPFLVRSPAWQKFFISHPKLEKFLVTQSPRFDLECLQTLLSSCGTNLHSLRLKEVGKLDDAFLEELAALGGEGRTSQLTYLDLSDPGESCNEDAMINLLEVLGRTLVHLNVSNHILLTDAFLSDGLLPYTCSLRTLILKDLPELTDGGVAKLFDSWSNNPPLLQLDLSRNSNLSDPALDGILEHSGRMLEELNVNGWKNLTEETLLSIGERAPELKKIDVGWVREMTDWVIKGWVDGVPEGEGLGVAGRGLGTTGGVMEAEVVRRKGGCRKLEEVKVWGCNRITANCPKKKGMSIYGVESHSVFRNLA